MQYPIFTTTVEKMEPTANPFRFSQAENNEKIALGVI
jgi:hypothetical protein